VANTSIEDAIAARGAPVWFQLYTTQRWEVAEGLVKRAEAAGAPAIAVTLDVRTSAKWETFVRLRRTDTRDCGSCHRPNDYLSRKPNFAGIDLAGTICGASALSARRASSACLRSCAPRPGWRCSNSAHRRSRT